MTLFELKKKSAIADDISERVGNDVFKLPLTLTKSILTTSMDSFNERQVSSEKNFLS